MGLIKFCIFIIIVLMIRYFILQYLRPTLPRFPPRNVPEANPVFPKQFRYGVSTSSYQTEADVPPSNWYLWEQKTDRFGNPIVPIDHKKCDGYNLFFQDVQLAQQIGCKFYRLSFSWSRLNPRPGQFDDQILQIYRSWLIKIRELGMEPLIVLWHFEHPAWLEEQGSILSNYFVQKYTEYVEFVVNGISDVCTFYQTVNEPFKYVISSFVMGIYPPGKGTLSNIADSMANLMQCHANAYSIIHRHNPNALVSYAKNIIPFVPRHEWSAIEHVIAWFMNKFNRIGFEVFKTGKISFLWYTRKVQNIINAIDFISINHSYCLFTTIDYREWSKVNGQRGQIDDQKMPFLSFGEKFLPTNDYGWGMLPGSLTAVTKWVHDHYNTEKKLPILISEHGAADSEDTKRQWFIKESLFHLSSLANLNYPICGYIHWTLFDNYDWTEGTKMRFGLFETDFATMERKPRKSAEIYSKIVQLHNNRPDF